MQKSHDGGRRCFSEGDVEKVSPWARGEKKERSCTAIRLAVDKGASERMGVSRQRVDSNSDPKPENLLGRRGGRGKRRTSLIVLGTKIS